MLLTLAVSHASVHPDGQTQSPMVTENKQLKEVKGTDNLYSRDLRVYYGSLQFLVVFDPFLNVCQSFSCWCVCWSLCFFACDRVRSKMSLDCQ